MLDDLQLFMDVTASKSFAACARKRGLTRAQVGKRIAKLEAKLGAQLLHRSTRVMRLTVQGEYLARELEPLFQAIDSSCDTIRAAGDEISGTLRVNAPFSFGLSHLTACLHAFMQQYPKVELEILLGSFFQKAFAGSFDVVISNQAVMAKSMRSVRFAQRHSIVCASASYLQAHPELLHPHDLTKHQCLVYAHPGEMRNEWHFQDQGKDFRVKVQSMLCFNSSIALLQAAKAGMGIVDLPDYVCAKAVQSGALVSVLSDFHLKPKGIYACYPLHKQIPRKVQIFVGFLQQYFG